MLVQHSFQYVPRMMQVLCTLLCIASTANSHAQTSLEGVSYGRKLVAQYNLSPEQVQGFQSFITPAENLKELDQMTTVAANSEDWIGPVLQVSRESGPYTVVVSLTGKAKFTGNVSTMWNAGWTVDGGKRLTPFPGLSKHGVKAGETVVITKATTPTRFKEAQAVSLVLALVKAENFDFEKVDVEIWSGVPDATWREILFSLRWFALGLLVLLLRYFWVRR